jgi:hypothetical protein
MNILRSFFKKSNIIFLLITMIMLCPVISNVSAEENNESAEIVILLDTSGSMNWADPPNSDGTRISTEAIKSFAFLRPSFSDTYISLVVYNQFVKTVLENTNIRTEWGITEYIDVVDAINRDQIDGFRNWTRTTAIGSALQEAYQILAESTASERAVLLFTDGRIDLGRGVDTAPEYEKAYDARDKFAELGIPVYTIGLNADGSVDREFLEDLSAQTNATSVIAMTAGELIEYFLEIYANLFGTVKPDVDPEPIPSGGILTRNFHVYGQAVKEVNLMFISERPESRIEIRRVITETGVDIINDSDKCIIDSSSMVSNIKLIEPMDGEWTIELRGNPGDIVKISEISLYDISLKTTIQDNRISLNYDEVLNFGMFLHNNERGIDILTTQIYEDSVSRTYMEVIDPRGVSRVYPGTINESSTGFNFSVTFDRPGDYMIEYILENDRLKAVSEAPIIVTVEEPVLLFESNGNQFLRSDGAVIRIGLTNGGGVKIDVPDYLRGMQGTLTVHSNGDLMHTVPFDINDIRSDNMFEYKFVPTQSGSYTFAAFLSDGSNASESILIDFRNPAISSNFTNSISHTISGNNNSVIYDLNEYFEIEGNGTLRFRIEGLENANEIDADINGSVLTISFLNKGDFKFDIIAFDDYGTEYKHTIEVDIDSFADTLIIIIVCVAIVIILLIAFVLFALSTMRIKTPFNLTLSVLLNGIEKDGGTQIYIRPLASIKRYKKPSVNLGSILKDTKIVSADIPITDGFDSFASNITLIGIPFGKRGFKVKCKGKKTQIFTGQNLVTFSSAASQAAANTTYKITFRKKETN